MTDKAREAGSGKATEPAPEQLVVKDKRKIDASGQAKNEAGRGRPEASMGQPGTPVGEAETGSRSPQPAPPGGGAPDKGAHDKGAHDKGAHDKGARAEAPRAEGAAGNGASAGGDASAKGGTGGASGGGAGPSARTGEVAAGSGGLGAELEALRSELDERLRDLQRVSAEYANYRKRVERDRGAVAEQVIGTVVGSLLPILDDLDRARDHGDLVGPFGAVAEQLNAALAKFGLTAFGEPGDVFDPTRHEAVAHRRSAEVTEPTCVEVMRRGYLLGERLLRAALVTVADPE